MGTMVAEFLSETEPVKVKKIGVPKEYATSGPYEDLIRYYGLDSESIAETVEKFCRE